MDNTTNKARTIIEKYMEKSHKGVVASTQVIYSDELYALLENNGFTNDESFKAIVNLKNDGFLKKTSGATYRVEGKYGKQ